MYSHYFFITLSKDPNRNCSCPVTANVVSLVSSSLYSSGKQPLTDCSVPAFSSFRLTVNTGKMRVWP